MPIYNKVCAIIVLFYPKTTHIKELIHNLSKNTDVILIDNTPNTINKELELYAKLNPNHILYSPQHVNLGIAEAQNIGIELATSINKASHLLFLDQDSIIDFGFSERMYEEYIRISNLGIKISALGPSTINIESNKPYKQESVSLEKKGIGFYLPPQIISSGMLISLKTLEDVGSMESKLFIDAVDFEWCWRAQSKGYTCCITENIFMKHKVGIQDKSLFGYTILISSSIRYFYQYRNFIILCKRSYVPKKWKSVNFIKKLFFLIYIPLYAKSGAKTLKYMLKGIAHGFFTRNSKYKNSFYEKE